MKTISEINLNTEEGKMLFASIIMLSTTEKYADKSPDDILKRVTNISNMFKHQIKGMGEDISNDIHDIIFATKKDAEDVLESLLSRIEKNGYASVSNLCELTGVRSSSIDHDFVWTNLQNSCIRKTKHGYALHMQTPRAYKPGDSK